MYKSTRGNETLSSSLAILNGIASDGGLYVIDEIPQVNIEDLIKLSYRQLAHYIISKYLDDFSEPEIKEIVENAYNNKFDIDSIVSLKKTKKCYFLELFHGPTLAFKDIALTILPHLILKSKEKLNIKDKTIILTATSGDTGSAALSGFNNIEDIDMIVFYPNEGVSEIQERQMLQFSSPTSLVIGVNGNFDDAQNFVKRIFVDEEFKKSLQGADLSSANSINIGRLIPQIVYYFYSYIELLNNREIKSGEKVNFVVPTGNFGNILAGYYAKQMGLPINKLICAANKNNVLTDFFNSGIYNKERMFYKTMSPSMDILISSNLERLLYHASNSSSKKVNQLINSLKVNNQFEIDEEIKNNLKDFVSYYTTEEETLETIKNLYKEEKYLIDTHTSVAYNAYLKYLKATNDSTKSIIASTAHPYKFVGSILKALGVESKGNDFEDLHQVEKLTNVKIPEQLKTLENIENKKIIWDLNDSYNLLKEKVKKYEIKN